MQLHSRPERVLVQVQPRGPEPQQARGQAQVQALGPEQVWRPLQSEPQQAPEPAAAFAGVKPGALWQLRLSQLPLA